MNHILIVDDDAAIRGAMQEYIAMAEFATASVPSAEEAIAYIENNGPVDVVITDIMMGGMDGLELTDYIRKHYKADVIIMTGYSAEYSYEEAISRGASDIVFKPVRFEELVLRLRRVLRERQLTQDREEMVAQLQELAITDGLTKLYNSRYFYNQLAQEVERLHRYRHPLALLLLDIDHFKKYNDNFGHVEGDKVLARMGEIICNSLRTMDSGYRYGGEEFTVILPETDAREAEVVAQRIKTSLSEEEFTPEGCSDPVPITASIGITEYVHFEEIVSFIQRADKAMYQSKNNGRNRISTILKEDLTDQPETDASCTTSKPSPIRH